MVDVTVKSGVKGLAPTWGMVMRYKSGRINIAEYTRIYKTLMRARGHEVIVDILKGTPEITLACYCKPDAFCHRKLLAQIFVKTAEEMDKSAVYAGEIEVI